METIVLLLFYQKKTLYPFALLRRSYSSKPLAVNLYAYSGLFGDNG